MVSCLSGHSHKQSKPENLVKTLCHHQIPDKTKNPKAVFLTHRLMIIYLCITLHKWFTITSYCSYARPAQPGPIWWFGPLPSDSAIKLFSVLFGKCTSLAAMKCWPMENRLPCGDQWKAKKLGAFWRWPITRCFIKSDRAGLIIVHCINFCLNGDGPCNMALQIHVIAEENKILEAESWFIYRFIGLLLKQLYAQQTFTLQF